MNEYSKHSVFLEMEELLIGDDEAREAEATIEKLRIELEEKATKKMQCATRLFSDSYSLERDNAKKDYCTVNAVTYIVARVPVEAQERVLNTAKLFCTQHASLTMKSDNHGVIEDNGSATFCVALECNVGMCNTLMYTFQLHLYNELCTKKTSQSQGASDLVYKHADVHMNVFVSGVNPPDLYAKDCMFIVVTITGLRGLLLQKAVLYLHDTMCTKGNKFHRGSGLQSDYIRMWCSKLYMDDVGISLELHTDFLLDPCDVGYTLLYNLKRHGLPLTENNIIIGKYESPKYS